MCIIIKINKISLIKLHHTTNTVRSRGRRKKFSRGGAENVREGWAV